MSVNPDLQRERGLVTFDPLLMTYLLDGGQQKTNRRRYLQHQVYTDPNLGPPKWEFKSAEERYSEGLRREGYLKQKIKELQLTNEREIEIVNTAAIRNATGISLHHVAFVPFVSSQSTPEQLARWQPLIDRGEMIGCYAQTELAHGSHVRGVETTATFDEKTDEFVINCPTQTAMKWWPGNLGRGANFATVIAQLVIRGKNYGPQAFLVQLRDIQTHKFMPGIKTGDIGPKVAADANDNGFLILNNVRIPRTDMLMKHTKVERDGTFVKPMHTKAMYTGMMYIRARLPGAAASQLCAASVIATRYSLVRRQSELRPGGREPQILDYQTQQQKIFPEMALAYGLKFVGRELINQYEKVMKEVQANNFKNLLDLHGTLATMKGYSTLNVAEGIERLRLSCGGHGYSQASGLPALWSGSVGAVTAEGEYTVMMLQGGKYLMKVAADIMKGKQVGDMVNYLCRDDYGTYSWGGDIDVEGLYQALAYRAKKMVEGAGLRIQKMMAGGMDMYDALNNAGVQLVRAAVAHSEVSVMRGYVSLLKSRDLDNSLKQPISRLCAVYAINSIQRHLGDYLKDGYMTGSQASFLSEKVLDIYSAMRQDAIAYADAFDLADEALGGGVLGRYDGIVYENMFKWAQESTLNQTEVHESFNKYLKPLRESKL